MRVEEIYDAIKKNALEGGEVELTGSNGQKLIVPLDKKDKICLELIPFVIEKYESMGVNPSIKDVLEVFQDSYWWLQTTTLLFSKDEELQKGNKKKFVKNLKSKKKGKKDDF